MNIRRIAYIHEQRLLFNVILCNIILNMVLVRHVRRVRKSNTVLRAQRDIRRIGGKNEQRNDLNGVFY